LIAAIIVVLLHIFFFLVIAPRLELGSSVQSRTEVIQISPQELNRLKQQIMKRQQLAPLMKDEILEPSKEAPKNAKMMGPHNQIVPHEQTAGPQDDAPEQGAGGGKAGAKQGAQQSERGSKSESKKLNLSKLGLGTKVAPPPKPQEREQAEAGPQGPPNPRGTPGRYRPVGREDKNLQKGDRNLLNAVESEYYSFFVRLEEPIIKNWYFLLRSYEGQLRSEMASRRVKMGSDLPVTIEFVLDRQGNFVKIDVATSSGIPILDWCTKESVKKLGSLPNPPPGLFENGQYFTRQLDFVVHVTDDPMMESRPDLIWQ
jgi:TonB family protein